MQTLSLVNHRYQFQGVGSWGGYRLLCGYQQQPKYVYKVTPGDVIHRGTEDSKELLLPISAASYS